MPRYKVARKQIIMMGVRTMYYIIDTDSPQKAEEIATDNSDVDCYDIDYHIEQTEDLEIEIEET